MSPQSPSISSYFWSPSFPTHPPPTTAHQGLDLTWTHQAGHHQTRCNASFQEHHIIFRRKKKPGYSDCGEPRRGHGKPTNCQAMISELPTLNTSVRSVNNNFVKYNQISWFNKNYDTKKLKNFYERSFWIGSFFLEKDIITLTFYWIFA